MTATSIACGVAACLVVVGRPSDHVALAALLVVVAGLLDAADGTVARWLGAPSRFGEMLDSLADALSFGVAPAVVAYAGGLAPLGLAGGVVAVFFALAAVIRLARYHDPPTPWTWPGRSRGLPTTMAGGAVAAAVACRAQLPEPGPDELLAGLMAAVAGLMLSELPFPDFKDLAKRRSSLVHFTVIVLAGVVGGVVGGGVWFFGVGAAVYLASGVVVALVSRRPDR